MAKKLKQAEKLETVKPLKTAHIHGGGGHKVKP